jgi:hypothetical protein
VIEVLLSFRQVGSFVADAERSSAAVGKVGKSAERSGAQATLGARGLLRYAAGAAAVYGAARFISRAVSETEDLAKNTHALTIQTGLSSVAGSEWLNVTKERGISAAQFSKSMQTLSKQMEKARGGDAASAQKIAEYRKQIDQLAAAGGVGAAKAMDKLSGKIASAQAQGDKARATLAQLGIPLRDIQKGMTPDVLMRVADAFKAMHDPAQRAADAQLLFGRAGYRLLPILIKGREGVQKLLDAQKEQGNYLTQKQVQANLKAIQQQRELSVAFHAFQTQLSLALLPILLKLGKMLLGIASALRPITSRSWALALILGGLTAAFLAYRAALIATWVWQNREMLQMIALNAQIVIQTAATWLQVAAQTAAILATQAWAVATTILGLAMDALPVVAIVAGVIALGVAFYEAYKHVGWFHKAVDDAFHAIVAAAKYAWNWIKTNWPYLVGALIGPFGLAVVVIIKHFGTIKKYALMVVGAIRAAIRSLVNWVETLPGKLGGILKKIPGIGLAMKAGGIAGHALGAVGLQHGGAVQRPGAFIVGERGPELVTLPAGALVRPTPDTASVGGRGGGGLTITVPVMLDRKVLAQAVARVASDQLARR